MKRVTQKQIAQFVPITEKYLSDILNNRRNPSRKTAVRLEQITGIPKEIWVFGSGSEKREAFNALKDVA